MKYCNLGHSGVKVSRICLGMMSYGSSDWQPWVLGREAGERFVGRALDAGVNFFDTADYYSSGESEETLGSAISKLTQRHKVVISTKGGLPLGTAMARDPNAGGLSRKHLRDALHASLRRLKTDYVDVYILHQPDPSTPLEETLETLSELAREGKVLHTGLSNYPAWETAKALYTLRHRHSHRLGVAQVQYNLCYREAERDLLPLALEEGLGVMIYSPLARGWLAGNRVHEGRVLTKAELTRAQTDAKAIAQYGTPSDRAVFDAVATLAEKKGVPPSRIALAWLLSKHAVSSLICGVLEDSHLDEAVRAVDLDLTDEEVALIEAPYQPQAIKDTGIAQVESVGRRAYAIARRN